MEGGRERKMKPFVFLSDSITLDVEMGGMRHT